MQAVQLVQGGIADCALALGFEKMERGSLSSKYDDRTPPLGKHAEAMIEKGGFAPAPMAAQFFGNAGKEHMEKYGTQQRHFTKIAAKNKVNFFFTKPANIASSVTRQTTPTHNFKSR